MTTGYTRSETSCIDLASTKEDLVGKGINMAKRIVVLAFAGLLVFPNALLSQQGPKSSTSETVARPRTKAEPAAEPDLPPIPSEYSTKDRPTVPTGSPMFRSDVTTVVVDVAVLDNRGRFIPGIPAGNFRIMEDKVPQKIASFDVGEAPMTVCLVIEFSNLYQRYYSETWYQTLSAAYGFLETLKPEDYVAVIAYDIKPEILTDFTTDKNQVYQAMKRLNFAGFSESNLFDALADTAERMSEIEGRKAIVVIASGVDTFSKLTLGETRRKLQMAGVPVYAIGLMQALRIYYDSSMGALSRLEFLQADNQMKTFAKETGGMSFFPRFYGEFPSIFASIAQALRNQYSFTYQPTNQARDGEFRKINVDLVDPANGDKLRITVNGKPVKYKVVAKDGYRAPAEVE